jgi:hypothetical protein
MNMTFGEQLCDVPPGAADRLTQIAGLIAPLHPRA